MMRGPTLHPASSVRRAVALSLGVLAVLSLGPVPAQAATPETPAFGPIIEDYASYQGQAKCKPKAKPGVVAFQTLLQTAFPDSTWFGISRGCKVGGRSEHKEGRALDWSRDASNGAQRRSVKELLTWLFAPDQHGNAHAMARRVGIMYIVWNRRIWSTWSKGWRVYCVQKRKVCKDPDSKSALHPHTDHVHFSFSWKGARMQTSFWHPEVSFPAV
jgi:hypothetical protein